MRTSAEKGGRGQACESAFSLQLLSYSTVVLRCAAWYIQPCTFLFFNFIGSFSALTKDEMPRTAILCSPSYRFTQMQVIKSYTVIIIAGDYSRSNPLHEIREENVSSIPQTG